MAVLQNIRNRAGVFIIIFVGVALFLFIIDPSTFNGLVNRQETNIAKIDGEKVPYSEFTARLLEVENFYKTAQQTNTIDAETEIALREQVWQEMLNDYLLGETFEDLGIQVSEDEMEDMLFGYHIHSIIQQNFSNPQTGMIDTNYVRQFFQNPDMDDRFIIITEYLKSQISKDRQNTKYLALLNHGMYTPTALAKSNYFNTNNKVDFAYIAMRYKDVADEEVTVTEDELMAYYEDHKYMFQNEESSRELEYIVFPVLPNTEDSVATKERMVELRNLFANTDDNMGFAQLHSEEVFANLCSQKKMFRVDMVTLFSKTKKLVTSQRFSHRTPATTCSK
jgi:peptidyl-prolyl cis-trans isomerase D